MINKKTGVIGDPIDHSLSPQIHNHWIERLGVNADLYQKINVKKDTFVEDVDRLIKEGYNGLNVTVPLKENAFKYCDELSESARALKAVNTLIVGDTSVYGENTDPVGFQKSILKNSLNDKKCLVLGAGGSARSVVYALKQMNCEVGIFNRTKKKAETLISDLGVDAVVLTETTLDNFTESANLVVNTTSLGQQKGEQNNIINFNHLNSSTHVYDLIYNPSKTSFLQNAEKKGCTVQNGLEMLINQAAHSFCIWHNIMPEIDDDLRRALGEQ